MTPISQIVLVIGTALMVQVAASANDLETRKAAFAAQLELFQESHQGKVDQLNENYRSALKRLQESFQKQDRLDSALTVNQELKRLETTPETGASQNSPVRELAALQTTYAETIAKLEADLQLRQSKVLRIHLKTLGDLRESYESLGKIDEALAVRDEIEAVEGTPLSQVAARPTPPPGGSRMPLGYTLYFPFDRREADGRVIDHSGNHLHGKSTQNSWIENGKRGGGFNAVRGDRITLAHDTRLHPESFTIAAWIKLERPIFYGRIWDKWEGPARTGYAFNVHEFKPVLEFHGKNRKKYSIRPEGKLARGKWSHVAVSFVPGKAVLYIDGELSVEKEMPEAIQPNKSAVRIGHDERFPLGGHLDELVFYPRALSLEEIRQVMSATGN